MTLTLRVRWWVRYYLGAIDMFCLTFGTAPDARIVSEFVARYGMRIEAHVVDGTSKRGRDC